MKVKFAIILLFFVLGGTYWQWWLPGSRVANDFSLISQGSLRSQLDIPQTWSVSGTEGLGEYSVFTLWSWPFSFIWGILGNLNLSSSFLERILVIIPFLLIGGYGIWKVCQRFNLSIYAKFISTLFYLTNTYILLVIDGGQLTISLAYALFPMGFLLMKDASCGSLKKKVLAGLLISTIGFFDIRFLYVFFLLNLISFFYELFFLKMNKWLDWIFDWLKTMTIITLIILGLNTYWLLVLFKFPLSISTYSSFIQTSFTSFISFSHTLLLLSPHWFKNVFGNVTPLRFEFIIFPILVFLAPILRIKDKVVGYWVLVVLVSLFLTKGSSEPLGYTYQWFYNNIPGFSLFRDSSKFFFLVALAYSILIGISLDEIIKRIKNHKIKVSFFVTLVVFLVIITRPIWLGEMTGTFSSPYLEKEYLELNNFITNDKSQSNIFWIPTISPLTILDAEHPALEASRLSQKRPFKQAILGTYETFNFVREASYMGQLFDVSSIGYVIYPPLNFRRDNLSADNTKYYNTFLGQLKNLPWLSKIDNLAIPTLKVNHHQDKFFIAPNIWWVIGSDGIYNEATKSSELVLSKNALIFPQEDKRLGRRIDEMSSLRIALYNKGLLDLTASLIKVEDLIFPAKKLGSNPDKNGWWKREAADLVNFKDFLQTKYGIVTQDFDLGGGWAIGEGNLKLDTLNLKKSKESILLARVMESSRSGEIIFTQGNYLVGKISTKTPLTNIKWFEIGRVFGNQDITISTKGDINIINALAYVVPSEWEQYENKVAGYQDQNKIVNFDPKNTDENTAKVIFKQLTPTKYIVNIQDLNKPGILVFSQSFDSKWKLSSQEPFPIYSLLNGYYVEKSGQYILEFEAQKYVLPGLLVSLVTLLICLTLLLV